MATTPAHEKAAIQLLRLAQTGLGTLKPAEETLVRGAAVGETAILGPDYPFVSDAANADTGPRSWGPEREIRAEVIRWLCVDAEARKLVDPHGVGLVGARITGGLNLSYMKIPFPIDLSLCRLTSDARFIRCQIPMLSLTGSWTAAIAVDGADIKYSVFLDVGFRADGEVSLNGAHIGVNLECDEGTFMNKSGAAIQANLINVGGAILLRAGSQMERGKSRPFRAKGAVWLVGARIGGDLDCSGGEFVNEGVAIYLARAQVAGTIFFRGRSANEGGGDLMFKAGGVDLRGTSAGALEDEPSSWTSSSSFKLEGFTYGGINPADPAQRLKWLELDKSEATPPTQPYRQAKVLGDSGDRKGAELVLRTMEGILSSKELFLMRWLRKSIGYGYSPGNAFVGLAVVTGAGWLVYWRANRMAMMVPTEKSAAQSLKSPVVALPNEYPRFNSFIFSLENTFPLVKLGLNR